MRRLLVPAASLLTLMVLLPGSAEAQRRGIRVPAGGIHRAAIVRPVGGYRGFAANRVGYYRRGYYGRGYYGRYGYYRPGYYGAGLAAGVLTTGAIAAAAASPYYGYGYGYGYPNYYGYGSSDPCLRQQQVWNGYAYQWQWVRVC